MKKMNLGFENTMPNNAQQVAKTAKKRENIRHIRNT